VKKLEEAIAIAKAERWTVVLEVLVEARREFKGIREQIRLIRLALHAEDDEHATRMIDELAGSLGLTRKNKADGEA